MTRAADIFFRPIRLAERIRERPASLLPGGAIAAVAILLFAAGYWTSVRLAAEHLPPSAQPDGARVVGEWLTGEFLRNLCFLPFRLLLGWGVFAGALDVSCRAFLRPTGVRFTHFLSLVIHAEAILLVGHALQLLHLPLPGLADLISTGSPLARSLLTSINLATLWYLLVLSIGCSVLCSASRLASALAAGTVWAGSLALNAGLLALLDRVYHFTT